MRSAAALSRPNHSFLMTTTTTTTALMTMTTTMMMLLLLCSTIITTTTAQVTTTFDDLILSQAATMNGFEMKIYASGLRRPRGLLRIGQEMLVLDTGTIEVLWDDNNDGVADGKFTLGGAGLSLSHGLEFIPPERLVTSNTFGGAPSFGILLASSANHLYAWPYRVGNRNTPLPAATHVLKNINAISDSPTASLPTGHSTRTLRLDVTHLYISVGSVGNVDRDSFRSRIRRFELNDLFFPIAVASDGNSFTLNTGKTYPVDFRTGQVFADGVRNEVGLNFDVAGVLWGVENGADSLRRDGIGGDVHQDNPAEEFNKFDQVGAHYGYPWCFTEFRLPSRTGPDGDGRGTVWAWTDTPSTDLVNGVPRDDVWCRTRAATSALAMQGHSAPLGVVFFNYARAVALAAATPKCANSNVVFPASMDGDAFVAFHGSWNRQVPTGYKVVHIPFDQPGGMPLGAVHNFMAHGGVGEAWPQTGVRPVDVAFDSCGRLLVTDDGSDRVFSIAFVQNQPTATAAPISSSPTASPLSSSPTAAPRASSSSSPTPAPQSRAPLPSLPFTNTQSPAISPSVAPALQQTPTAELDACIKGMAKAGRKFTKCYDSGLQIVEQSSQERKLLKCQRKLTGRLTSQPSQCLDLQVLINAETIAAAVRNCLVTNGGTRESCKNDTNDWIRDNASRAAAGGEGRRGLF